MARIVLFIAVFLSFNLSILSAAEQEDTLAVLEGKLVGTWDGSGPCDARMIVNSDGSTPNERGSQLAVAKDTTRQPECSRCR